MMRHKVATYVLLTLVMTAGAFAQAPRGLEAIVGPSPAEREVDGVDENRALAELEASTDDTTATIKTGWTISTGASARKARTDTFSLSASAPLSKTGSTSLVSGNGFPNAFVLSGKFTRYLVATRNPFGNPALRQLCADVARVAEPEVEEALVQLALDAGASEADAKAFAAKRAEDERKKRRDQLLAVARELGQAEAQAAEFADRRLSEETSPQCDSDFIATNAPERLAEFDAFFWEPNRSHLFWGFSASVGRSEFKYLNADLSENSAAKTPWGASLFGAIVPPRMRTLITGGLEHRDKYKAADDQTICPQDAAAAQLTCKTGPLAGPADVTEELAFVEVRRKLGKRAASLKVAYDFESENFSADLPIYLIPSSDKGLAGGLRFGWTEKDGAQYGVFVSSTFTLTPK